MPKLVAENETQRRMFQALFEQGPAVGGTSIKSTIGPGSRGALRASVLAGKKVYWGIDAFHAAAKAIRAGHPKEALRAVFIASDPKVGVIEDVVKTRAIRNTPLTELRSLGVSKK